MVISASSNSKLVKNHKRVWRQQRGVLEVELERFTSFLLRDSKLGERDFCCFSSMFWQGFRIGEAVKLKKDDINFLNGTVRAYNWKTGNSYVLPLNPLFAAFLRGYIARFEGRFVNGYLVFPTNQNCVQEHMSERAMYNIFYKVRKAAGLTDFYVEIPHTNQPGVKSKLYRFTPHSLRFYFIRKVYLDSGRDFLVTQKLARHVDAKNTGVYIETGFDDMVGAMNKVFGKKAEVVKSDDLLSALRELVSELKK